MSEPRPLEALAAWPVGSVLGLEPAGGTAGRTWMVTTSEGRYFLRLRGARTSSPARLAFDHGLRRHLAASGLPTVAPLPGPAGRTWLESPAGMFELYPWVEGRALVPGRPAEVGAAAQVLARFHLAARSFRPADTTAEVIGQYAALGLDRGTSPRLDDPELQRRNLLALKKTVVEVDDQRLLDRCLSRVEVLCREYGGPAYARLAEDWVGHGDYTP
ncbi:MAG: phosphotransferase, partial [Candidatus Latescibacterota bacterium]